MKIAFVHQPWNAFLPPNVDGSVAIWVDTIARRLAPDHEVLVLGGARANGPRETEVGGVRYRTLPLGADAAVARSLPRARLLFSTRRPHYASALYYGRFARELASALRSDRPDVVHLQNLTQLVEPVHRAAPSTKIVLHMHCEWLSQLARRPMARRLRHVETVVCCSEHVARSTRAAHPGLAHRVRVVPNGVDTERFHPAERGATVSSPHVLFVGRLTPEKGAHVLLEAFRASSATTPTATLTLLGPHALTPRSFLLDLSDDPRLRSLEPLWEGDYEARLMSQAAASGDRVRFGGAVPHKDMPAHYRAADIVALPSYYESFGIPPIEAMACGRPVVTSNVAALPETVEDGQTGLLVEPGDARGLAAALTRLSGDEALRADLGAAGRRRAVERWDWGRIAAEVRSCYGQP